MKEGLHEDQASGLEQDRDALARKARHDKMDLSIRGWPREDIVKLDVVAKPFVRLT
jgi:hypothetical protein